MNCGNEDPSSPVAAVSTPLEEGSSPLEEFSSRPEAPTQMPGVSIPVEGEVGLGCDIVPTVQVDLVGVVVDSDLNCNVDVGDSGELSCDMRGPDMSPEGRVCERPVGEVQEINEVFLGLDNGQVYDKAVMVSWGDDKLERDRNVKSQQ